LPEIHLTGEESVSKAVQAILSSELDGTVFVTVKKVKNPRTVLQNRSAHLYFRMMADGLNNAGIDQVALMKSFKEGFKIPNTMESIKGLFSRVAAVMLGEERTSRLSTKEIQQIYEAVDRGMNQKFGITYPWPSDQPPMITEHDIRPEK